MFMAPLMCEGKLWRGQLQAGAGNSKRKGGGGERMHMHTSGCIWPPIEAFNPAEGQAESSDSPYLQNVSSTDQ